MTFKFNIAKKEKTFKLEAETEAVLGMKINGKVSGQDIFPDLKGYEFEISGASDNAGFPQKADVEGTSLKRRLLSYEFGMKNKPRGLKKKISKNKPKGLRLRKTVRGNTISQDTVQINLVILKEGEKKLEDIFPDQVKGEKGEVSKPKDEGSKVEESKEAKQDNDKAKEKPVEKAAEKSAEKPEDTVKAQDAKKKVEKKAEEEKDNDKAEEKKEEAKPEKIVTEKPTEKPTEKAEQGS